MSGFFSRTDIAVRTSDGLNVTVLEPFVFTRPNGETITVCVGATSDGVSAPREAWSATPPFGAYWLAGVLHDAMYRLQTRPLIVERATADAIFLEAMEALKVPRATRIALYEAVHQFGEAAWIEDRASTAGG